VRTLQLEALTAAAFAPFGDVIDAEAPCERLSINDDRTQRHHALAHVDCAGEAAISLFRAQAIDSGFSLQRLERHPLGSQAFINVSGNPYAIVVAPPGPFDERLVRGFLASRWQSINYHCGVWHHYLLALEAASDFVVVDRVGPGDNYDEVQLASPIRLDLP
jgi:ureidoglycolate lyase